MKFFTTITAIFVTCISGCSQNAANDARPSERSVGGGCEGCEAIFEFGDRPLTWTDTLPDFNDEGQKLEITGTIYHRDGKTPAKDVILYVYHTDQSGRYPRKGDEQGWARRHGYIRGWIKTNADGKYKLYTLKPGAYPQGGNPAHIHPTIKEPGIKEYWIDEYLFEGDPYLTAEGLRNLQNRGGSGILKTTTDKNGMLMGRRDIILGLNVPGH